MLPLDMFTVFEEKTMSFFPSDKFLIFTLDSLLSTLFRFFAWRFFVLDLKLKIEIYRRLLIPNKQRHAQSQLQKGKGK